MKQRIEVVSIDCDTCNDEVNGDRFEVWIEFLDWHIVISAKDGDDSVAQEEITIIAKHNGNVTDDFFAFTKDRDTWIRPNGMNLYQTMDLLLTNYKKKHAKGDD